MIHTLMTSQMTEDAVPMRSAVQSFGWRAAFVVAFLMAWWGAFAQAQSPIDVAPPRNTSSTIAPGTLKPSMLSPPRPTVQGVGTAGGNVTLIQPPKPSDNSTRDLVAVAPPGPMAIQQPSDVTAMAPAINAVRTQLEIMSPPPAPSRGSASSSGPMSIDAPSLSTFVSTQPQQFAGPTRINPPGNDQSVQQLTPPNSASQFSSRTVRSPPSSPTAQSASLTIESPTDAAAPGSLPAARIAALTPSITAPPRSTSMPSILEMTPPAPINNAQASQRWGQVQPALPNSNNPPLSPSQVNASQGNPTLVAQSPFSSSLPDNYRPLAPPAQPGPQPGASFSQSVGSNQVTIIPPPGAPTAPSTTLQSPTTPANVAQSNNFGNPQSQNFVPGVAQFNTPSPSGTLAAPSTNQVGPPLSNAAGIEVITVDPNNFVPGGPGSMMMGNNEPVWQFNFQNAPWSVVIRNFAKQNGMALQMLTEPTGTFTFVDERPYPASEALDLLNDYLLAEGFLVVRNGNKLTTVTAGGPIQEGIVPFVPMRQIEILGRNELASVAIPIKAADAAMVMNEVQSLLSRVGRAQVVSNSSRLVITDTGAYLRRARDIIGGYGLAAGDIQTVVVHLKNTTADSMSSTISAHLGISLGASSGVVTAGGNGGPGSVQTASFSTNTTMNMSSTRVIPDRETNSLLISGTPAEVADIQSLICQLDQARAQVILQGLILEVNLGNVKELGAELGLQDSVLFNRSVIDNLVTLQNTNTAPNGVQTTNQNVVSQTSAPGFNFNGQPLGNNTAVSPNVIGAQGLGNLGVGRTNSQLGFGGLVLSASSNSVSLLLRALQANYEVDVLSRPQIRTVDNKEAFIQIGQQVPVVDGVNVTAVGTANPIIRQDQAGIILKMTPNVSPDGLIQIKVSAEKSAFKLQPGTGVPIFTDARNGTVIQAPIKDITTAQATISARAGQTIVLGGMITRDEETIERRVPGLSRIPLLGRLFRYDYNNVTRKELLIFLTPHLIADDASSDAYKDAEINRTHAPLEYAEQMHGQLLTNPPVVEQVITSE